MTDNYSSAQPMPLVVNKRRTRKTSERIAHDLIGYISDNRFTEGTALPTEAELVERLGVGRSTVREALLLLETWGVITVRAGRNGGPTVRHPRPEDLREALEVQLQFNATTLRDIVEAREAIEPASARLAAQRMTDEQIDRLQATVDGMRVPDVSQSSFLELNRHFHSLIAEATGNAVLQAFVDSIKAIADGAVIGIKYESRHILAVADAHDEIVTAIRARDGDAASAAMSRHLGEAGQYWAHRHDHDGPVRRRIDL